MRLDVLWYHNERMSYSCCAMLNEVLDSMDTTHHTGFGIDSRKSPPDIQGAVVVFHGGNEAAIGRGPALAAIMSAELVNYKWVIWVNIGDEESAFSNHLLVHRNDRLWVQTPKPGRTHADRYLVEGYMGDTQIELALLPDYPRDLDWFFAGQVTHERRIKCVCALEASRNPFVSVKSGTLKGSFGEEFTVTSILHKTQSFGAGLSHPTYYEFMRRAKIVPCPAGPATPDSFRMYEALEAGAVPVLDAYALDGVEGYWDMVFPGHPFFVVRDWASEWKPVMDEILAGWDYYSKVSQDYWRGYKRDFSRWIVQDLLSLGAV